MTPELLKANEKGPYTPMEIHRRTKYLYEKGKKVYLLTPPEGKTVYVMQAYTNHFDKGRTIDKLDGLAGTLKLPSGWTYKVKTLDKDLTIEPGKAGGVAHIIQDDLRNTYEGCGFDAACDFVPKP